MGKADIKMSAEMLQNRETWVAKWGATGGDSTVYFDEDFMMGINDKSVWSPIWGLEDVLPGHIFTQRTMLTKMFLDIYIEGVGDNEEVPAIQIARSKMGMRDGQLGTGRRTGDGGLEVTEDEEGKRVGERVGNFDCLRLQAVMVERLKDGPHRYLTTGWIWRLWTRSPHWDTR